MKTKTFIPAAMQHINGLITMAQTTGLAPGFATGIVSKSLTSGLV